MEDNKYTLGNFLRGGFSGDFSSVESAWSFLGSRFLLSFPSDHFDKDKNKLVEDPDGGRYVKMMILKKNEYGIEVNTTCKSEVFYMKDRIDVNSVDYKRESSVVFF